mgnify:CR=1 FL=1
MINWNVEGLKNIMTQISEHTLKEYDVIALTETLTTTPIELQRRYSAHSPATQGHAGRPYGGISCYVGPKMGSIHYRHAEEDYVLIKTDVITLIGMYIKPRTSIEEIIETIMNALSHTTASEPTVITGDFNCRLDNETRKTKMLIEALEEEGFSLANRADHKTYFAPNGSSTIDLTFYRVHDTQLISQKVDYRSPLAPLRKHTPVITKFNTKAQRKTRDIKPKPALSRKLHLQTLAERREEITSIRQLARHNTTEAILRIQDILQTTAIPSLERKAKPWFDSQCYKERQITLADLHQAKESGLQQDTLRYTSQRKKYKVLLKEKRNQHLETEAQKLAEAAMANPYLALKRRKETTPPSTEIDTWVTHFKNILNPKNEHQAYPIITPPAFNAHKPISTKEIKDAITHLKKHKAPGPDSIFNEHLTISYPYLCEVWETLLNKCIQTGTIPEPWRESKIKLLYKGKGKTDDPNAYRGIALESSTFKVLTTIITKRVTEIVNPQIPKQQYGFRKGRSCIQAVEDLVSDINEALRTPKQKYYAIFIDYAKAFDHLNREMLSTKLEKTGLDEHTKTLIKNILSYNIIRIDDSVTTSEPIVQTRGVLQGDPLSPILFNIATADVAEICSAATSLLIYADDMTLGATNKHELQESFDRLINWADKNDIQINTKKTVQMVFRRGGKITPKDAILYKEEPLKIVNAFRYLGVTIQTTMKSYRIHIKERATAATKGIFDIKNIRQLSLDTALKLLEAKIIPILCYGIEICWENLSYHDLKTIENVKARFLKMALGLSKYTSSRLVYELAREPFLMEELRLKLGPTTNWAKLLRERQNKRKDIWPEFYTTNAMNTRTWMGTNQHLRHIITGLAVHGYHHKLCKKKTFHDPSNDCVCELCDNQCDRYHITNCSKRTKSINEYVK